MKDSVFIDTNIFLYSILKENKTEDLLKQKKAEQLFESLDDSEIVISTQIINEIYVNLQKNKFSEMEIRNCLNEIILDCKVISLDLELVRFAWNLKNDYMFSYWDSLIVSAAIISDCKILYSEDMQDKLIVKNKLQILNPFL